MTIASQINDVLRRVDLHDSGNTITLSQTFRTSPEDLWAACTTPERLARWFEPVEGDLRLGGRYRMTDSGTSGTIEHCDPPHALTVTWEHGGDSSRVTVTITGATADSSTLTVRHHGDDNEYWREYGPAAGGSGWDAALLGLAMTLEDPDVTLDDVNRAWASPDGMAFIQGSCEQWSIAHQRAGATQDEADAAAGRAAAVAEQWTSAE